MRLSVSRIFGACAIAAFTVAGLSGCETGEEGIARLISLAEKGDVSAMLKIAEIYCGGINIEQDDQVCGIWMRRAAEYGNMKAQFMLGGMYEHGLGMRADPVQAYRWYSISAEQGYHMSGNAAEKLSASMLPAQLNKARTLITKSQEAKAATGRYFVAGSK
ncbi:MAG: sel1 repeat family protein [Burkholderiaceae bacterium]|jgi:TPR repeat protein|nr:sel1 repeat family protein [Burkholderiaceae bacterium]